MTYLKKLQANIQASLRQQGVTNTAEQAESRRQNAQMAKEAQKKINHRENEQRLNNLLKDLEKRKAEQRKAEAEARKKAAEARLVAAEKARKEQAAAQQKAEAERAAMSTLTDEDMKLQAPSTQGFTVSNANSFSRMQGRLKNRSTAHWQVCSVKTAAMAKFGKACSTILFLLRSAALPQARLLLPASLKAMAK